jgi:predicted RNA binding protein YcfA (HicA-like mRNA interferase family)
MRPVDWKELKALCEKLGCSHERNKGDHCIMTKEGLARPAVFPMKKDLKEDIVLGVGRTLGINRKQIEEHLNQKKKSALGQASE